MLGVLCNRQKPWILSSLAAFLHGSAFHHQHRFVQSPIQLVDFSKDWIQQRRCQHSRACKIGGFGGAASIWHAILPSSSGEFRRLTIHHEQKGEGSWNVAWDARPARWLHRPDSAWLLFGVCGCLGPLDWVEGNSEVTAAGDERMGSCDASDSISDVKGSADYRITGVPADGRCLFRAIAHCACLRNGEEAPDENLQRELADKLRAQVVDELLKRREETEWFLEEDFDSYVKRLREPYVWGGEPELLMASHVLKTPISVFMRDRSSGNLSNIAKYGEEYGKNKESAINVLFHGYGHYDILETCSEKSFQNLNP